MPPEETFSLPHARTVVLLAEPPERMSSQQSEWTVYPEIEAEDILNELLPYVPCALVFGATVMPRFAPSSAVMPVAFPPERTSRFHPEYTV